MTVTLNRWRGALPRAVLAAVIVALLPLPAAAGETPTPAKASSLQSSIAAIVARETLAATPGVATAAREAGQGTTADKAVLDSPSFFKSKAGIIALTIVAVGAGGMFYAMSHDRIHSVARAGQ
ncbi:MAG: hypothetical protein NTY02_10150 [Acidobacteria bacterium]|nr:hypothetical protein [Acidobacteriota bacterium]